MKSKPFSRLENVAAGEYELLDCGAGEKLERFGERVIARPSSICIWQKQLGVKEWDKADARYEPKAGWQFKKAEFESWQADFLDCRLELRLQMNGQVGLFPEHRFYLKEIGQMLRSLKDTPLKRPARVLNLFAYTGLATMLCAKLGAQVCHVDLSRKALTWANANLKLNGIKAHQIRLICEDALKFLHREAQRNNQYEIVIADPPSFSRTSKSEYWKLEDLLPQMIGACRAVFNPRSGMLALTCHHPAIGSEMLANLLFDAFGDVSGKITHQNLFLQQKSSGRLLAAGCLALYRTQE